MIKLMATLLTVGTLASVAIPAQASQDNAVIQDAQSTSVITRQRKQNTPDHRPVQFVSSARGETSVITALYKPQTSTATPTAMLMTPKCTQHKPYSSDRALQFNILEAATRAILA